MVALPPSSESLRLTLGKRKRPRLGKEIRRGLVAGAAPAINGAEGTAAWSKSGEQRPSWPEWLLLPPPQGSMPAAAVPALGKQACRLGVHVRMRPHPGGLCRGSTLQVQASQGVVAGGGAAQRA